MIFASRYNVAIQSRNEEDRLCMVIMEIALAGLPILPLVTKLGKERSNGF